MSELMVHSEKPAIRVRPDMMAQDTAKTSIIVIARASMLKGVRLDPRIFSGYVRVRNAQGIDEHDSKLKSIPIFP